MRKKLAALVLVFTLIFGMAIGAQAASTLTEIKALLNPGLSIKLNGLDWKPKDAQGINVAPITYKGTTYLPLRSVAEAAGVAVDFDAKTQTVFLGEKPEGKPILSEKYVLDYNYKVTREKTYAVYNGEDLKEVIYGTDINSAEKGIKLTPAKKFQKIVVTAAVADGDDIFVSIVDLDHDIELVNKEVLKSGGLTTIEADIGGLQNIEISVHHPVDRKESAVIIQTSKSYYK